MTSNIPGVCRYCRCTVDAPCRVAPYGSDDTCAWVAGTMNTVCTGASCLIAWERERKLAREDAKASGRKYGDRYKGWGYGAIVSDLRRRQRGARGRTAA